jgi:hypothetical protein
LALVEAAAVAVSLLATIVPLPVRETVC